MTDVHFGVTVPQIKRPWVAAAEAARAQKIFGGHMGDPKGPIAITGTAEQCVDAIARHIDLGCTMFMMEFFGRDTMVPAQLFAEEVAPHFRTVAGGKDGSGRPG